VNCSKCAAEIAEGAAYCSMCGEPAPVQVAYGQARRAHPMDEEVVADGADAEDLPAPEPGSIAAPMMEQEPDPPAPSSARVVYAGFWLRLFAYVIDSLLLGVTAGVVILGPLMASGAIPSDNPWMIYTNTSRQFLALRLLILMVQWVYFALFESSPWQASPGKKVLGLMVTDVEGKRISFARATARYFCTLLSGFILMAGFIMIAFTERKQGLHDILTGCLVIKKV
jgi:uncharacterized RDD family membrane protein YckC